MGAIPDWMHPPRAEGWYAEDLDHLPEAPRHTELIDGALIFMMSPQLRWHGRTITALTNALTAQAPPGFEVDREMTIRLDERNRPEADVVVTTVPLGVNPTWFAAEDVVLAVEVVSPESAHRDHKVKTRKYAEAGIPHYWIVEEVDNNPVVQVYELDARSGFYVAVNTFQDRLERAQPFPIVLDLKSLVRL